MMPFILQQLAMAFQLRWPFYLVSWLIFIQNLTLHSLQKALADEKVKKIS
jgi:hypothetical protein